MNKYQELKIWDKAMNLVEQVYSLMMLLPEEEKFGLVSQVKKSSVSIPSNIAEGAGRNSSKEFIRFLSIANGSTTELETQLILIVRLKFVSEEKVEELLKLCTEIKKMNYSLQKSIERT
ncbi:four helix bundle protein [Aquimarina sp. BL5]|uniref:four helix bundle protein n=1 Tax=Aquimarina sp. BL5 TaxID=1714860 RepID=UPI000E548D99|nr:four helix bundle protein [Aquimarina sp. BL5]AXT49389.1 four helix bundle protein [Aquimarina sp. BL5]RKN07966.1 four helix bundle protein [Aquimarina sp. BL5]